VVCAHPPPTHTLTIPFFAQNRHTLRIYPFTTYLYLQNLIIHELDLPQTNLKTMVLMIKNACGVLLIVCVASQAMGESIIMIL
jgi:hypothetical protein